MGLSVLFEAENKEIKERYQLAMERIQEIIAEDVVVTPYQDYFKKVAGFLLMVKELIEMIENGTFKQQTLSEMKLLNAKLYEDILIENYHNSYGNPAYATAVLGSDYSDSLSFLYTELRSCIPWAYESRLKDITIHLELFIEIYVLFCAEILPEREELKRSIYWHVSDYCDRTVAYRVRELLDPALSFGKDVILNSDLNDIRYLYHYGEYISDTEIQIAEFMNGLPIEKIKLMADVYTEGFRKGFEVARKDLSKKKTVVIRYEIGFERMVRIAIDNFKALGLEVIIYRHALNAINKNPNGKVGFYGTSPNRQFEYDHRYDHSLFFDKALHDRKLSIYKLTFEEYKDLARGQAGPAVIETFGEKDFQPVNKEEATVLTEKQQKLEVSYANESMSILYQYISGDERSFTIIAFPIPDIGSEFPAIFEDTIAINTLNYELYRDIQQKMIDALDEAEYVLIKGKGQNQTDLKVCLQKLVQPAQESNFENCVADVNIPVGEIFTSPRLTGTEGILHVSHVCLGDFSYEDLKITFKDGRIADYTCKNFDSEEENQKLIKSSILHNHETLPMGEFAIGTNTTAYAMVEKYGILEKMPILIAEKMGPHFAVGDTCYSRSEDVKVYNPGGKEITARDNEISIIRKEDAEKAYFNCHTDITIPYKELDTIIGVRTDGSQIVVIKDGRFVLAGTEELNIPLT